MFFYSEVVITGTEKSIPFGLTVAPEESVVIESNQGRGSACQAELYIARFSLAILCPCELTILDIFKHANCLLTLMLRLVYQCYVAICLI